MMKANYKKSFLGSAFAFILGSSCCWLSSLAVWLGGATFLGGLARWVDDYSPIILGLALLFLVVAIFQFRKHLKGKTKFHSFVL